MSDKIATVRLMKNTSGPLSGQTVAITGALSGPLRGVRRPDALAMVAQCGGRPAVSVTKQTTMLVAARTDTAKCRRARERGVQIIDPVAFAQMLGHEVIW